MRTYLIPVTFILGLSGLASRAEEKVENPYQHAKVGDWVLYKMTAKGLEDSQTKQTVLEKDDKKVVVEMITLIGGKEKSSNKLTIDLTEKKDPAPVKKENDLQITDLGSGNEVLKIGDKKYNCTWKKTKVVVKVADQEIATETTTWFSKDVPLGGLVRTDLKSSLTESRMEIVDFGSKK